MTGSGLRLHSPALYLISSPALYLISAYQIMHSYYDKYKFQTILMIVLFQSAQFNLTPTRPLLITCFYLE